METEFIVIMLALIGGGLAFWGILMELDYAISRLLAENKERMEKLKYEKENQEKQEKED